MEVSGYSGKSHGGGLPLGLGQRAACKRPRQAKRVETWTRVRVDESTRWHIAEAVGRAIPRLCLRLHLRLHLHLRPREQGVDQQSGVPLER